MWVLVMAISMVSNNIWAAILSPGATGVTFGEGTRAGRYSWGGTSRGKSLVRPPLSRYTDCCDAVVVDLVVSKLAVPYLPKPR
jgi:hypothetical protein